MKNSALLTCHCGAVEINLILPNGIEHVQRCSCSMCSRKYAVFACVDLENLELIKGKNELKEYTFHTHTSKHWFCSICGIHTHHHARNTPTQYVINLGCLEGVKVENFADAPWFNGRKHPKDQSNKRLEKENHQ